MPPDPDSKRDDEVNSSSVPVVDLTGLSDSSSDEEERDTQGQGENGYELLPQDQASACAMVESDDEATELSQSSPFQPSEPDFKREWDMVGTAAAAISTDDAARRETLPMTDDHVEKIKSLMANIKLPTAVIPSWASDLEDDSWAKIVEAKIKKKDGTGNK